MDHYRAYGGPKPPPIDHQGIESAGESADYRHALEPPLTKSARPVGDTEKVAQEWLRGASGFERRAILPYQRATVSPQYWPFPASPRRRAVNQKRREFVAGSYGSSGRIRTYNPSVNSRTVCSRLPL